MNERDYNQFFGKIPIFGMIHLAGINPSKKAIEEINLLEASGMNGVIIENYHGSVRDVVNTLERLSREPRKISIGVNILPNEFEYSFLLANKYGADFIQLDHVSGSYNKGRINSELYEKTREKHSDVFVLGGVWPKYYTPVPESNLEKDLVEGVKRADAIVVTGERTGKETPLEKIIKFREIIGESPLVIGAGLNLENAYEQLPLSNGAIVGSLFKVNGNTHNSIDKYKVKDFMDIVKEIRANKVIEK